ncbi:MAG: carbohydrate ABC transporter permease [Treponema sp.]|nr:carbohydrate ABC transporter permease [Treponema sp.]
MRYKTKKAYILRILKHIVLCIAVFLTALPFISMLGTAFKEYTVAMSSTSLIPMSPDEFSVQSFKDVIFVTDFMKKMRNSFVVTIATMGICIILASCAGYAISRFRGRYFRTYSVFLLIIQMFPTMLLLIPLYRIFAGTGLLNNLLSVILTYTATNIAFSIWMLKGFFDTIPRELEQAAMVDGCSRLHAYVYIILPLVLPGITTVAIFTFINTWNEYTFASVFLRRETIMTMTVGLQRFVQQFNSDWTLLMAASTIATIPALIFLFFAQKYLVEGMTAGAVKG